MKTTTKTEIMEPKESLFYSRKKKNMFGELFTTIKDFCFQFILVHMRKKNKIK